MIVFAHTKFGLVQISDKGSRVKGGWILPPWPEQVFEILTWIELLIS